MISIVGCCCVVVVVVVVVGDKNTVAGTFYDVRVGKTTSTYSKTLDSHTVTVIVT